MMPTLKLNMENKHSYVDFIFSNLINYECNVSYCFWIVGEPLSSIRCLDTAYRSK